jgi:hypothetical protein
MTLVDFSKAALFACLFPGFLLLGADDNAAPPLRRLSIGIHVVYFPLPLVKGGSVIQISNNPVAQYNYTAASDSPKWSPGAQVEYRLTDHLALAGELHFHHTDYTQTTDTLSGYNTSTTGGDNRPVTTMVETSQVNCYEIPILAHYYGFWSHGWKRRMYFSGGLQLLHVGKIRTGNDFTYPSGATDYNENPAIPKQTNTIGAVVGVGMRLIDEFHIRLTPEVRFVRWQAPALQGVAYRSYANQVEAQMGLSF